MHFMQNITDMQNLFQSTPQIVEINVKPPIGKPIPIKVCSTNTFFEIKKKIYEIKGIPLNEQQLYFIDQRINDFDSVSTYQFSRFNDSYITVNYPIKNPINITAKSNNNYCATLTADKYDTIRDIKYELYNRNDRLRVEYETINQAALLLSGIMLDESKTLADYLIRQSVKLNFVYLEKERILVFIKNDENFFPEFFFPTDKVSDVKARISGAHEIDISNKKLIFEGQELEDEKTLLNYRVYSESTIEIQMSNDNSEETKNSESCSYTNSNITLHIITLSKEKIEIEINLFEKVKKLKEKIEEKTEMKSKTQKLFFNGKQLVDEKHLHDYSLSNGNEVLLVHFEEKTFNITTYIKSAAFHTLLVHQSRATELIKDIKKKIEEKTGIPADRLEVVNVRNGFLQDENSFQIYNIDSDVGIEVLHIERGGKVILLTNKANLAFPFELSESDTVEDLKEMISERACFPKSEVSLSIESLDELENRQEVRFRRQEPKMIQINVKMLTGSCNSMMIGQHAPIFDVKEQIMNKTGIQSYTMTLVFKGGELLDHKTVEDYQIADGDSIYLVLKLRG